MEPSRPDEPSLADPWAAPSAPQRDEDPGAGPVTGLGVSDSVYQSPPADQASSSQQTPPPYQGPPGTPNYPQAAYPTATGYQPAAIQQPATGYPPPGGYQPGYGAAPYGQPGFGPPDFRPPRPTNSLPQAAMITGVIALVIGNAISIGVLGIIGGIVGVVLGIMGLRRARRWGVGSSGLAAGGIIVSTLSVLAGVAILVAATPAFLDGWNEGWEEGMRQADEQGAGRDAEGAGDDLPSDDQPAPGEPIPAEWMNPDGPWLGIPVWGLGLGQATTINEYTVSIVDIELAADEQVAAAHPRNPLPYGQYLLVTVSVRNQSVLERDPLDHLMVSYPAMDDFIYDETSCGALTARPVTAVGVLGLNEAAEYDVCLDVPRYAIGEPRVLVHDLTSEYWDAWLWEAE